jgi:hypothetical protein
MKRLCERFDGWLAHEQMDVLWHHDISEDAKPIAQADAFKRFFKPSTRRNGGEVRLPTVATERDKMKIARELIPLETLSHRRDCRQDGGRL